MKKIYEAPALDVFTIVSDRSMASMDFSDLQNAANNSNGGALLLDPTQESLHDVLVPKI